MSVPVRVIEPRDGWRFVDVRELLRYRDLIYFLVKRDVMVRYAQTVLGFAWAIIRPLITMLMFTLIFNRGLKIQADGGVPYPLFSYVGLVPWIYFSTSMNTATASLVGNALLSKVYFPRLVIPLVPVLANLVDFAVASSLAVVMMVRYQVAPSADIVWLPFLVLIMMLAAAGIGMWLSALAIQYRDIKFAVGFLAQILMYAAPVIWPASKVPEAWRTVYGLYPMAGVIDGFRAALLRGDGMPWDLILPGAGVSVLLFVSGAVYFQRREQSFADIY